jgi:hypothetical protein
MAVCASTSGVPVVPGLGLEKCDSGSATPQKTRPMPMPAANSIENQGRSPNSGTSSSAPSRMSPHRPSPTHSANATNPATSST